MNQVETFKDILDLMFSKMQTISINDSFANEITLRRTRIFEKYKSDAFFFECLVRVIFNAGFKSTVITRKWPDIKNAFLDFNVSRVAQFSEDDFAALLNNQRIIRHQRKLRDCISNAQIMITISEEYGSFGEFLDEQKDNFDYLKQALMQFGSVGKALVYDFLKDIGMDFIKPDVHVMRVLYRLDLISADDAFYEALTVAEEFKQATNERLSVIDSLFWMYGGGGNNHLQKAVCGKIDPLCEECPLTNYCSYFKFGEQMKPTTTRLSRGCHWEAVDVIQQTETKRIRPIVPKEPKTFLTKRGKSKPVEVRWPDGRVIKYPGVNACVRELKRLGIKMRGTSSAEEFLRMYFGDENVRLL